MRNIHVLKFGKWWCGFSFFWLLCLNSTNAQTPAIIPSPTATPPPEIISPTPTPTATPTPEVVSPTPTPTPEIPVPIATPTVTPTPEIVAPPEIVPEIVAEDLIHFGDLIEINLTGNAELNWRGTVDDEGFLSQLPYVDTAVFALCKSEQEIGNAVAVAYAKYFRNPEVSLRIIDRSKRPIATLLGAIRTPQKLSIQRPVRLNELLVVGGGITENASGEVRIFRPNGVGCETRKPNEEFKLAAKTEVADSASETSNKTRERIIQTKAVATDSASLFISIKITDLVAGKAEANPFVRAGDVVTVQEAEPVYVTGGVVAPQKVYFRQKITLTRAIATTGGFINKKNDSQITVYRRVKDSLNPQIIEVDYAKIRQKLVADLVLQAYDIIEVKVAGRAKSLRPPVIEELEKPPPSATLPLRVVN